MAITSASIEANGWVLRLTHTLGLGSFASYTLDPTGTPRLTLATAAPGFAPGGGGGVVAQTFARSIVATRPLRQPISATANGTPLNSYDGTDTNLFIDEVDLGGGTCQVRIALSAMVYATDASVTLAALAGWRTGEAAASGIAVTNTSTIAAPAPLVRWSDVPYQLQGGSFDLEVCVVALHPNGLAPVAGVLFTVTDGTTVKSFWATALGTSTRYTGVTGDGTGALVLRVYKVTVDPTTATALTRGLLRCDYKVFPWIGPARSSDTADTALAAVASANAAPSMTNLGTAALATAAQVPFVVAYNPGGAFLTVRYAYVNPTGGPASAAAANVSTSAATAATTPLATVSLAVESLRLWAVANAGGTLPAANGQAAVTQSVDGCRIRLAAGVHSGTGTGTVATGVQTAASWLVIEGDPADSSPRVNCVLRAPSTVNGNTRLTRTRFANLSIEAQTNACATTTNVWLDGVEVRAVTGNETGTGTPVNASGFAWVTGARWWRHGTTPAPSGTNFIPVMVRATLVERSLNAPFVASCARLPTAVVGGGAALAASTATVASVDAGSSLDRIAIGNDLRYISAAIGIVPHFLANGSAPATLTGLLPTKAYAVCARQAWVNNVFEAYGATQVLFGAIGENNPCISTQLVLEGNTFAGDRCNGPYDDLNLATIAINDTENNYVFGYRVANNILMRFASKHDNFTDPVIIAQRMGTGTYSLASSRNKAKAVGDELVVAGSPANVYRCTTAGTTATTGGPSGTGSAIADGTVVWQWTGTESRTHGYRAQATGAWNTHYGVGFEKNVIYASAGDEGALQFRFAFYGLGTRHLNDEGIQVTAPPFVLDKSGTSNRNAWQPLPDGTGGGNYLPLTTGFGAYAIGKARNASSDADQRGAPRIATFAAGALEPSTAVVNPASARSATRASTPALGVTLAVAAAATRSLSRAGASAVGWFATLGAMPARQASRAAAGAAGWAAAIASRGGAIAQRATGPATSWGATVSAAGNRLASRATATATGWSTVVATAGATLASRAAAVVAGWAATLAPDGGIAGQAASAGGVDWTIAFTPAGARQATAATMPTVAIAVAVTLLPDSGALSLRDLVPPTLPPGGPTPPGRTLFVTDDVRLVTIAAAD